MKNIREEIEQEIIGFNGTTFSNHTQSKNYIRGMLERISAKALELKASEESNADLKRTVIKEKILNDFHKEILYPEIKGWGIEPSQVLAIKQFISKSIDKALSARDEEWEYNLMKLKFDLNTSDDKFSEGYNKALDDLIHSMNNNRK